MLTLEDFKEDLALFVESGLIAIKQGDEESAKKLFNAVGIIDPHNSAKKMGYGLISLHKMDLNHAKTSFGEILNAEPENYRAMAFLAFAHILSTMQDSTTDAKLEALRKGAEMAQQVVDKSDSPTTRQLAQSLLDWEKELMDKVASKGPMS